MWEILGEGMLGYVILVDSARPDSLQEAAAIRAAFRRMARVPFVVGLNRSDGLDEMGEAEVRRVLDLEPDVPVVPCDATDRESVKSVLLALLYSVVDTLDPAAVARA
jgi:signal recognition particle receptor subunit beta